MGDVQDPQARVGGAYTGGTNPSTGAAGDPIGADEISGGGSGETPDPHGVGESDSQAGESFAPPPGETKGATNRPVGQVEGDLMEPNDSGAGTSDVGVE